MTKTKYFTETVEIDVSLDDWEDQELIEELEARGYKVEEEENLVEAFHYWSRGQKKEALILLEREFKWLRGISDLAN
jgi:hypothetical protein